MRPRDILAANIKDLTAAWSDANKHKRLREASGIPNGTLERIEKAAVSAGIDWLEPLSRALECEPWELLAPPHKRAQLRALFNALQAAADSSAGAKSEPRKLNGTDG
jgi:DNA-binding Xre family transcriptional regulator